jgi:hypothetical protein
MCSVIDRDDRSFAMASRGPGLTSRGNRIVLAVAVAWVAWLFAGALEMPPAGRWAVLVLVAGIVYGLATVAAQRSR